MLREALLSCSRSTILSAMTKTRGPTVEDIFYPSDPDQLTASVKDLLEGSDVVPHAATAVIAPHAAFDYAGRVMASALAAARDRRVDTVVILGPIHRDAPAGFVLPESEVFQTPIGDLPVDMALTEELMECSTLFSRDDIPHLEEHSIEAVLPFVAHLFPQTRIVPLLIGHCRAHGVKALSHALSLSFGRRLRSTLFVVSANIASFCVKGSGSREEAERALALIEAGDWRGILEQSRLGKISACGAEGIASLLAFDNITFRYRLLDIRTPGKEVARHSIHYAAVSLTASG